MSTTRVQSVPVPPVELVYFGGQAFVGTQVAALGVDLEQLQVDGRAVRV